MHAVVIAVTIAAAQFESAVKVLKENIVPQVGKAPGFVKGYWTVSADRIERLVDRGVQDEG